MMLLSDVILPRGFHFISLMLYCITCPMKMSAEAFTRWGPWTPWTVCSPATCLNITTSSSKLRYSADKLGGSYCVIRNPANSVDRFARIKLIQDEYGDSVKIPHRSRYRSCRGSAILSFIFNERECEKDTHEVQCFPCLVNETIYASNKLRLLPFCRSNSISSFTYTFILLLIFLSAMLVIYFVHRRFGCRLLSRLFGGSNNTPTRSSEDAHGNQSADGVRLSAVRLRSSNDQESVNDGSENNLPPNYKDLLSSFHRDDSMDGSSQPPSYWDVIKLDPAAINTVNENVNQDEASLPISERSTADLDEQSCDHQNLAQLPEVVAHTTPLSDPVGPKDDSPVA